MKFIRHRIIVPESHSFMINKLDLSQNTDVIHSHINYELNYIVSGKGRRFIGGNISLYGPGDLVLMGPDLPHGWEVDNSLNAPRSITIHFKEDLFDAKLFRIPEFEFLEKLLEKSKSGIHFRNIDIKIIEGFLLELMGLQGFDAMIKLLQILRYLTKIQDTQVLSMSDFIWRHNKPVQLERINKVYDYVFHNYNKDIRLKDVAELVNLSESAFCSYFKKLTKKSFFAFLKEVKIGYACKLLTESNEYTIAQICYNSGFNNMANFNRQFREVTNLSPREYRIKYAN